MKNKGSILYVDDDRLILASMADGLSIEGYYVHRAENATEALQIVNEEQLDLALLDICLPGDSGIDVAIEVISKHDIPVIFLSAFSDQSTVEKALSTGAHGYLVKPLTLQQLIPEIEMALIRAKEIKNLRNKEQHLNKALDQDRSTSIAIGLLMERHKLDQKEAFNLLRNNARSQRKKVSDLAHEIVSVIGAFNMIK